MKIVFDYPPNIEKIKKILTPSDNTCFTYGDTIYNPGQGVVADHLMVHEQVHSKQQTDPEAWWDRYLKDPQWRLEQEIEAYHAQYKYSEIHLKDRNQRAKFLWALAHDLSGPIYGNVISFWDAMERIKKG